MENVDMVREMVAQIMDKAGLTPVIAIATHVQKISFSGPNSWGADERNRGIVPEELRIDRYIQFIEEEIRENIASRAIAPFSSAPRIRFPIEFYSDRAIMNKTPRIEKYGYPDIATLMYRFTIGNLEY